MHKNIILFLLLSLFSLVGCENKEQKLIHQKIETAIGIGEDQPLRALQMLDSIQDFTHLSKDNVMLFRIAEIKARRNARLPIDLQQADLIKKASEYFEKKGDIKNATLANYYTGVAYEKAKDILPAFTYYLKTLPYCQELNDSLMMGKTLYNIASAYYDQKVYDSTNVYLQKALPLLTNYPKEKLLTYRLLASSFYLLGNPISGLDYLNKGLPLLSYENNKQYAYLYNETYGTIYKRLGKYDEATQYLRKNLKDANSQAEKLRTVLNLTDIYGLTHNNDSALYYKQAITSLLATLPMQTIDDDYLILFAYRVMQDYYIERGDKINIKKYIVLHSEKQADIETTNLSKALLTIDQKTRLQQIETANHQYGSNIVLYIVSSIAFLLAIFIIISYIVVQKNKEKEAIRNIDKINELQKQYNNLINNKY